MLLKEFPADINPGPVVIRGFIIAGWGGGLGHSVRTLFNRACGVHTTPPHKIAMFEHQAELIWIAHYRLLKRGDADDAISLCQAR